MFDHVMLQNELFYVKEGKSLIKEIDNYKIILVLDFLQRHTNRMENIGFSLEKMITYYGYKVSSKKGESVDQFKHILKLLQDKKIIEFNKGTDDKDINIEKIKSNIYIECKLQNNYNKGFIQLFNREINTIYSYDKNKVDNIKLLALYCYIKARVYKQEKGKNVVKDGGRAETCYCTYDKIYDDIGISKESATKYVNALVEVNLIRYDNPGVWYYSSSKEIKRESPNIYCLFTDEEYCKTNLKEGIKQYKNCDENKGKIYTKSREYKHNNRKLNGEKGSIVKKINKGIATEMDINRLKEIDDLINGEIDETTRLTALFKEIIEKSGELILSEYYDGYKQDLSDKYYDLEKSLGLLDEIGELTVDYDYYKWIMINYEFSKHDYYINCVKKHIDEKEENKTKHKGLWNNGKKVIVDKPIELEIDFSEFMNKEDLEESNDSNWGEDINFNDDEIIDPVYDKTKEVSDYIINMLDKFKDKEAEYIEKYGKIKWTELNKKQIDYMFAKVKSFFNEDSINTNDYLNRLNKRIESKVINF